MNWDNPKRDKSDFFEDFTKEELEAQPASTFDRNKKEKTPPPRVGPLWEVDESHASDFVKDFFKPS
jgi:hypothetical protein